MDPQRLIINEQASTLISAGGLCSQSAGQPHTPPPPPFYYIPSFYPLHSFSQHLPLRFDLILKKKRKKNTIFTDIDLFTWNHGAIKGLQNNCDTKLIFFYVNTNLFVNIRMMGAFLGFQEIRILMKQCGIFNFSSMVKQPEVVAG